MKKRVLLTGGTGFIGRNIRESMLNEKYTLLSPTRQEMNLLSQESVDRYLEEHPCDVLIHSAIKPANRAAKDLSRILADNSQMFFHLFRNQKHYKRMIHLGSGSGYDMRNYFPKMKETDFGNSIPADELGLYKFMVGSFAENVSWITDLRIFGIFGKYEDYSIRFISNMICKALFDLPLTMKQDRYFDYLFIDDLIPILDHFIDNDNPAFSSYNVTPDTSASLVEIANAVKKICEKENLPLTLSCEGVGMEYSGDNARLKQEIKGLQFTSLEFAIRSLVEYYVSIKERIDETVLQMDK